MCTVLSAQELIRKLKENDGQIVIFGAGFVGELTRLALAEHGIECAYFADNNPEKEGHCLRGVPIVLPESLPERLPDAVFLIATIAVDLITHQLSGLGYSTFWDPVELIRQFEWRKAEWSTPHAIVERAISLYDFSSAARTGSDKCYVKSLDAVLTEKCSLRCKDCANLMQYYEKPADCNQAELWHSLDRFMASIDRIFELRILGGEPLLMKNFHESIRHFLTYKNCDYLIVYTNGTIVPKGENLECLKDPRILVSISDYGPISRNLQNLCDTFQENGIIHLTSVQTRWQDCGDIILRKRSREQLQKVFEECCANDAFTLLHGKLYRCPFAAHAVNLGAIQPVADEIVSLGDDGISDEEIQRQTRNFCGKHSFVSACSFCAGRDFRCDAVPAAVQAKKPLMISIREESAPEPESEASY